VRARLIGSGIFVRVFRLCRKVKSNEEANTIREQEIARREKALETALEYHLKNEKLTQREIDQIRAQIKYSKTFWKNNTHGYSIFTHYA
jgi:hypothetical protein